MLGQFLEIDGTATDFGTKIAEAQAESDGVFQSAESAGNFGSEIFAKRCIC